MTVLVPLWSPFSRVASCARRLAPWEGALAAPEDRPAAAAPSMTRRSLLRSTAALPVGCRGGQRRWARRRVVTAAPPARAHVIPEPPPDLEGLQILQLSDLHLGVVPCIEFRGLVGARTSGRVRSARRDGRYRGRPERARFGAPDHGEVSPASRRLRFARQSRVPPRHRGRAARLRARSNPASRRSGHDPPDRRRFALPRRRHDSEGRANAASFLDESIRACAAGAVDGAFRLLLCHRPSGFPAAAANGFDLTLSGHTHGGQIGAFGRSLFRKAPPRWLPLGILPPRALTLTRRAALVTGFHFTECPTEIPLITLERG